MILHRATSLFIDKFQAYSEEPDPVTGFDVATTGRNVSHLLQERMSQLGFKRGSVEVMALEAFVDTMVDYGDSGMVPPYGTAFLQTARKKLADAGPYLD
ncbi:MAG: hypothetical protein GF368_01590 [Candidatus Aenigmarchaeota archaeon]|nr:hypothetical protein [Candidatus Aenigmarchaeota archaeon]